MKKIIFSLTLVFIFAEIFGQTEAGKTFSKDYYLQKSKNQKTVAWLMLGGGTALAITGFVLANKQIDDNDPLNLDNLEAGGGFAILGFVGVGTALGSIPFFISSVKNKRKAASISFNNQKILVPLQNTFVLKTQLAFTLKIHL